MPTKCLTFADPYHAILLVNEIIIFWGATLRISELASCYFYESNVSFTFWSLCINCEGLITFYFGTFVLN